MADSIRINVRVSKVDETRGIVLGWAIVCKRDGEDYYDLQGDHIPEDVMLKAALSFAMSARVAKVMHEGEQDGTVAFLLPICTGDAEALGFEGGQTGLIAGAKFSKKTIAKFKRGELTEYSIGGTGTREPVAEAA